MFELNLPIGPFNVSVKSNIDKLSSELSNLYSAYPALTKNEFIDFNIELNTPNLLRSYYRPQVNFSFNEYVPFLPLPKSQAHALFEWGLNWCIVSHAPQYLIFHAGAIEKNNAVILLPAESGSGKSTLCAGMMLSGWRLFSDELGLISVKDGLAYPCTKPVSLKNNAISVIREQFKNAIFSSVARDTNKGDIALLKPSMNSVKQMHKPEKVKYIVFPKYNVNEEAKLDEITDVMSFQKLIENSFNYNVLGEKGFDLIANILKGAKCYCLEYSSFKKADQLLSYLVGTK